MKDEEDDNNLDRVFKEGLSKAEDNIAFRNDDWDAMEQLLDEEKKRRGIIFRLPVIIGAIAAMLLLALGFFFLRPELKPDAVKNTARVKPSKGNSNQPTVNNNPIASNHDKTSTLNPTNTAKNTTSVEPEKSLSVKDLPATQLTAAQPLHHKGFNGNGNTQPKNNGIDKLTEGSLTVAEQPTTNNIGNTNPGDINTGDESIANRKSTDLQAVAGITLGNSTLNSQSITDLNPIDKQLDVRSDRYAAEVKQKQKMAYTSSFGYKHPVVLSVLAAPDFNGVNSSFARTQVGTTVGMALSIGLTKKLTISTGALYAKKPYMVPFSEYSTSYNFKTQPTDVYADCRVLDIPINIDYSVYNKGANRFSIGTGLSSYFMLRENYHFDYDNTGTYNGPSDYDIKNQNKHIMGVLNLNADYQRRLSAKFGLNIRPYMKLPLTDIGYGKVNLQSTGLAVGFSWFLTSAQPR
ncbi:outer membrane beta-barrel protein [Mucilaginibacter agri]|uniref:Outer membrane protein beta-barrel domain-containing protein n=1 Tax=Mucilaginibacter agri TaxID=2695265 RepID=A0A965ZDY8_9SPHI|nr:outer membrane beta-barrel protein [Mucilaginibacter agri]NCD69060.1 hypothetical protein [Mucilaginibacter agri]